MTGDIALAEVKKFLLSVSLLSMSLDFQLEYNIPDEAKAIAAPPIIIFVV